jgi:transglutaminase-like putative cysteine protease
VLPTSARLQGIPEGIPGAAATLRIMRQLVRDSIRDPSQRVRETALAITGGGGFVAEIRDIQSWVQDNIRYILDPTDDSGGVELVQTPQKTLDYRAGDCDDQSTLTAALLCSIGHPTQFVAVGFRGESLSHVLCQTLIGSKWAFVETIQPQPLGWIPPGITSQYILKV